MLIDDTSCVCIFQLYGNRGSVSRLPSNHAGPDVIYRCNVVLCVPRNFCRAIFTVFILSLYLTPTFQPKTLPNGGITIRMCFPCHTFQSNKNS